MIKRIASFLHIVDASGQLDIVDLSFVALVCKVMFAPGIDYAALGSLIAVILSKMHADHLEASSQRESSHVDSSDPS